MTFSVLHKINQQNEVLDVLIKGQKGLIMMRRRLKFWPCLSVANEIRHMINVRKRNLTLLHTSRKENIKIFEVGRRKKDDFKEIKRGKNCLELLTDNEIGFKLLYCRRPAQP